jgi:hypothetical protein
MEIAEDGGLLPQTDRLLDRILSAATYRDLDDFDSAALEGIASYTARPDANLPFVRFQITEADPALLALTGMATPGFDVLRADCGGFQFHWRNDLARAFDERIGSRCSGASTRPPARGDSSWNMSSSRYPSGIGSAGFRAGSRSKA